MLMYFSCEAINVGRILKELGEKSNFVRNFRYTLIGFFFSAITPAASGGQPMEVYYMHKDKISVANSTLTLLMQLCSYQIVTLTFAIFSHRLSEGLVKLFVKILKFFRVKNIEEKQEKIEKELESYQGSAKYIKAHKLLMLKTVATTLVQMLIYYSIPYWVYLSFGFTEQNIWQILTLQAVLYATVSGIPSPGAVGVSEGGFMGIFKNVFPQSVIGSAMILNRGINFYLFVILSAILAMVSTFRDRKEIIKEKNTEDIIEKQ